MIAAAKSRKLPSHGVSGADGEGQEALAGLAVEGRAPPDLACRALELPFQVGLDVVAPLDQRGQREGPQVDARQEVVPETPFAHGPAQVPVGARDQLEIALDLAVGAERQEGLLLEGAEEHGLLVEAELADLVEEEHPAVGRAGGPAALLGRAGEGSGDVTEERRHGLVAADRGAVDLDELAGDAVLLPPLSS